MHRPLPTPLASGSIPVPADDETYVYRAYCRCGELLYVGLTSYLFGRMTSHRRTAAPWEMRVARLECWRKLPWPTIPTFAEIHARRLDRARALSIGDRL